LVRKYNWEVKYDDLSQLCNGVQCKYPFATLNEGTNLDFEMHLRSCHLDFLNRNDLCLSFQVKVSKRDEVAPVSITAPVVRVYISNPQGVIVHGTTFHNVPLNSFTTVPFNWVTFGWDKEIPDGCTVRISLEANYSESDFETLGEVESRE